MLQRERISKAIEQHDREANRPAHESNLWVHELTRAVLLVAEQVKVLNDLLPQQVKNVAEGSRKLRRSIIWPSNALNPNATLTVVKLVKAGRIPGGEAGLTFVVNDFTPCGTGGYIAGIRDYRRCGPGGMPYRIWSLYPDEYEVLYQTESEATVYSGCK